jgi:uncharacterized membrane protein
MTPYFLVKYRPVLGAIVILGIGNGIAFFMLMAHRSGHADFVARTASTVVLADIVHPGRRPPATGLRRPFIADHEEVEAVSWDLMQPQKIALGGVTGQFRFAFGTANLPSLCHSPQLPA